MGVDHQGLAKVLEAVKDKGERLSIAGHTGFCYDAIGSALALKYICDNLGTDAQVVGKYSPDWGYTQNNILYNLLELGKMIKDPESVQAGSPVACVDVYPGGTNGHATPGRPVIVIDHHPVKNCNYDLSTVDYVDTRPAGSATALVVDHMMNLGIEFSEEDKDLATLLLFAVRMDTKMYTRGVDLSIDHKVGSMLYEHANMDTIKKIESRTYPEELLGILNTMKRANVLGKYRVVATDVSKPGLVPQLADFLSSVEEPPINIVVARVKNIKGPEWHIRGRSRDPAYDVADRIRDVFGTGGGHWYSAGANMTKDQLYELCNIDSKKRKPHELILKGIENILRELSNEPVNE